MAIGMSPPIRKICLSDCIHLSSHYLIIWLLPFTLSYLLLIPVSSLLISSHLSRRRKERGGKKADGEALEGLEAQLRDRAESLGLALEQKSKSMKQRDKKVMNIASGNLSFVPI